VPGQIHAGHVAAEYQFYPIFDDTAIVPKNKPKGSLEHHRKIHTISLVYESWRSQSIGQLVAFLAVSIHSPYNLTRLNPVLRQVTALASDGNIELVRSRQPTTNKLEGMFM